MPLSKLNIRGITVTTLANGQTIFPVNDTHTLIQAAGYLKHVRGSFSAEHVFFAESQNYIQAFHLPLFAACQHKEGHPQL